MRALALLCASSALVGAGTAVTTARADGAETAPTTDTAEGAAVVAQIDRYQRETWRWQRVMGETKTASSFSALRSPDPAYRRWVLALWKHRWKRVERRAATWLGSRIRTYRGVVDHWERVMGLRGGPVRQVASASASLRDRHAQMVRWRLRARQITRRAAHPPYESAWLCIHRFEGSWTDRGAPYYGGLQMDLTFQAHYGGYLLRTKGTADKWTPLEQMWVAARAHSSGRGFYPWPNTARACGLI